MDTQIDRKKGISHPFDIPPGCRVMVGMKQLRKALAAGKARRVYLARNADPGITEPFAAACEESGVEYVWVPTMAELGRVCGIEVGAAAAAIVDSI